MIWCAVNFTLDCSENSWYKWNVRQMCGNIHIHLHRMLISCAHTRSNWFTYTLSYILKQTQIHAHFRESEREREPTASNNHNIENEVKWEEQHTHTYTHTAQKQWEQRRRKKNNNIYANKVKRCKDKETKKKPTQFHIDRNTITNRIFWVKENYIASNKTIFFFFLLQKTTKIIRTILKEKWSEKVEKVISNETKRRQNGTHIFGSYKWHEIVFMRIVWHKFDQQKWTY